MKKDYFAPTLEVRRFCKDVMLESSAQAFRFDGEDFYSSDFFGDEF